MEADMKFKLFYHRIGIIEIGKLMEEQRRTFTKSETEEILNKLFDIVARGDTARAWGFSFQAISNDGQCWAVDRDAVDKEHHTFTLHYSRAWNDKDAPRRMRRADIFKDIMGRGRENA